MALVLNLLSYVSLLVHVCFVTLSFASALYYISQLVEEFTEITRRGIKYTIIATIAIYVLLISETFSWLMLACGILAQLVHLSILRRFPSVEILSIEFVSALILLLLNHYLAYKHFQEFFYSMSEILAYFTLCLWLVPFALFVSLSANDNVLPQTTQPRGEDDVITNYFSTRKRQNLLSFFKSAKDQVLPTKKSY